MQTFKKLNLDYYNYDSTIQHFDESLIVFNKIGRWWHKGKKIDIVALNEKTREILFAECTWKDNIDGEAVLAPLKGNAHHVEWVNDSCKEHFVLFGKSFSRRPKDCLCFDLKDLKELMNVKEE